MANYTENFSNYLAWAMPFARTGQFPLDRTDLFSSYADAVKYAAGNSADPDSRGLYATSYVGQIITVYENDVVTVYKINADRTLGEVGKAVLVDDTTVTLTSDGKLTIKGVAEAIAANPGNVAGLQPVLTSTGSINWVRPDTTTVEGLSTQIEALNASLNEIKASLEGTEENPGGMAQDVTDLQTAVGNDGTDGQPKTGLYLEVDNINQELGDSTDGVDLETVWSKINKHESNISTIQTKLDTVQEGAEVNVQADWNQTDSTLDDYIKNKPDIAGSITAALENYYTKNEIDTTIGNLATIQISVVENLPETGAGNVIYLKAKANPEEGNGYDEYLWNGTAFEKIGDTSINLTGYATTEYVDGQIQTVNGALTNLDTKVSGIDDRVTALETKQHATVSIPAAVITAGTTSAEVTNVDNVISMYATDSDGEQVIIDWDKNGTTHTFSIGQPYNKDITVTLVYLA